jgi:hypothetical protein
MFNNKLIRMNINPINGIEKNNKLIDIIENGNIDDFVKTAKEFNIFQESNNKFYLSICEKIRARLQKENLTEDVVKNLKE